MTDPKGRTIRVASHGFLTWHLATLIAVALSISGVAYGYLSRAGSHLYLFIAIWFSLTGVSLLIALLSKASYPSAITLFADRLLVRSVLGTNQIRIDKIGPPTFVEKSFVWFRTSPDAPGYRGTVLRVNGEAARLILASPHRQPWVVPPDLAQKIAALDS